MLFKFFSLCLIFGVIYKIPNTRASNRHAVKAFYTRADCFLNDTELVSDFFCGLVDDPKALHPFLGARLRLSQDISIVSNLTIHYRLTFKRNGGRWETYLTTVLNVCEALGQMQQNFVLKMMTETIWQHSNLPYQCPLKKNVLYVINATMESSVLPPYIPELDWASFANFYILGRKILTINCVGKIARSSSKKKKQLGTV